jgi:hypothetical protein
MVFAQGLRWLLASLQDAVKGKRGSVILSCPGVSPQANFFRASGSEGMPQRSAELRFRRIANAGEAWMNLQPPSNLGVGPFIG